MGSPKHLLPVPTTGNPLYQHLIDVVHVTFPSIRTIYFSVTDTSTLDDTLQHEGTYSPIGPVDQSIKLVRVLDKPTKDIGPAAGLLAAHQYDQNATWLIVACDFPLLEPAALLQLRKAFEDPVTCFVNQDGFSEPLLAIWSPQALRGLSENVEGGRSGPNYTVKQLGGKLVSPIKDDWILNTNTPEEWKDARPRIKSLQSMGGVWG